MSHGFNVALHVVWLALLSYWLWSARRVKTSVQTEHPAKRLVAYWLPLAVAFALLGPGEWFQHTLLAEQFVPHSMPFESLGLLFCVLGASLACWARYLLGENWSATVQLKDNHQLITAGPYRLVRHPIYSGFLLLFLGNAVLVGDWRGLLALAIVFASFWRKLRLEERWLSQHFGEAYRAYSKRSHALVPGLL
ncbi:MAG TPA: isoprenylcysteine carboxylmethyltransferase family protein [Dyella sp.]|uniref:methyltransferase family protein n=1 Tax=Dyella sp. TaxID=1869338 RepID=UPI002D78A0B8|nr:isoprenylcysteine carboxylmethyltransferase family protein [Dyella sp.]HET6552198.1 isoprenylcysteine carboxylmethyltransferase family protein [Dyella sp.]